MVVLLLRPVAVVVQLLPAWDRCPHRKEGTRSAGVVTPLGEGMAAAATVLTRSEEEEEEIAVDAGPVGERTPSAAGTHLVVAAVVVEADVANKPRAQTSEVSGRLRKSRSRRPANSQNCCFLPSIRSLGHVI